MSHPSHSRRSRAAFRGLVLLVLLVLACARMAAAAELVGQISDQSGVHYLGGAEVTVTETGHRAVTGSDGRYRIVGVPAGDYTVVVRYVGAEDVSQTVSLAADESKRIDIRLAPTTGKHEQVIVIGQRASQSSALSQQRASDIFASFLTRDGIGQFPDQNVSESVRRLPGVSVQNDQGEGRFIVLRGLDPNLNAASLNGVRVPAPESDIRAVALDVVAAELVESIEVQKSLIPEMDGDAIGGAIDIKTTSALDRGGPYLSVTGAGSYNDLADAWSPKIGVDASTMVNDRFGISVGFSFFDRDLDSDNVEADDWTEAGGAVYAEEIEFRNYEVSRERIGGTLGLDFVLSDTTRLFARGIYSSFEDQEFRSRLAIDFGDAEPVSGDEAGASFNLTGDEEISVERDIKDRNERQEIISVVLGGETFSDLWTFNYQGSYARAEEDESDSFDPKVFARDFEAGELRISQSDLRSLRPGIEVASANRADFVDASAYEFDSTEDVNGLAEDEEFSIKFDVARDLQFASAPAQIKVGGKARWREKSYDLTLDLYDGFDGAGDFTLADVASSVDYPLTDINPVPSAGAVRGVLGDLSNFERNDAESLFESTSSDFEVDENIYAGYVQMRTDRGPLRIIGGLRVEHTEDDITGNRVELVEEDATINGVVLTEDTTFVTPVEFTTDYTEWLPSLNFRYEMSRDVLVRLAGYRSLVRPNIQDLAPRFAIEQDDGDERTGEFGNPDLDPFIAWNVDFGAEWYFADSAVLQAGLFYKSIDDFIVRIVREDFTFNGVAVDEGVVPVNGDTADLLGFEFNYHQAMTMLPEPFDGFIIGANYTYVDSEGEINGRNIMLPATSEHVFNFTVGYEKGPFSMRLAGAYRDEYLDELSEDGTADRFVLDHFMLDASARYRVTENAQVFFEAINITDEPFQAVQRTPDFGDRAMQHEEYSFTLNAGIRVVY